MRVVISSSVAGSNRLKDAASARWSHFCHLSEMGNIAYRCW